MFMAIFIRISLSYKCGIIFYFYRICVDLTNRQMARTYRSETYTMIKSVLRSPGRVHFFVGCSSIQNAKTTFQAHNTLRDTGQSVRIKAEELFFLLLMIDENFVDH